MKVISLGWGIQSFTLAAMSALGELPPVDAALFSDTRHERAATYEFASRWTDWLQERGVWVFTLAAKDTDIIQHKMVMTPAHTLSEKGGLLRRQCTPHWKIAPQRKWLAAHRKRQSVEMWLGISLDEIGRAKPSDVKYLTHRFPLLEKRMSRQDCIRWLERNGLEVPPKSACVFCPYHSRRTWRDLKANGNGDWSKAIEVDDLIRGARKPYDLFLHATKKPLREIGDGMDLQPELDLTGEECSGSCFL